MSEIEHMIKSIKKLSKPRRVKTPLMFMGSSSYIIPETYGTVLVIGTWNYPIQLTLVPMVRAIIEPICENSKIMQEEIFGPIMPILEFENFSQAISFINKRPKPLALYIFSKNKSNISKVLDETSSGGVCINDTINHISTPYLPFGGVGDSGMGSYHGTMSFETFTYKKSVLRSQTIYDMKVIYPPYKVSVNLIKKAFKYLLN